MKAVLLLIATAISCAVATDDVVSLRQVDEYLVGAEQVSVADFALVVDACDGVEDVEMTGAGSRVVGIGASTLAGRPALRVLG